MNKKANVLAAIFISAAFAIVYVFAELTSHALKNQGLQDEAVTTVTTVAPVANGHETALEESLAKLMKEDFWSWVYPYSVVKGGVHNVAALRTSINDDPVVREHYRGFNLNQARMITADAPKKLYASYRIKDKVFWTSKPLTISKGEALVTDGVHLSRARCANRLSETAPHPSQTSPMEPGEEDFELEPAAGGGKAEVPEDEGPCIVEVSVSPVEERAACPLVVCCPTDHFYHDGGNGWHDDHDGQHEDPKPSQTPLPPSALLLLPGILGLLFIKGRENR